MNRARTYWAAEVKEDFPAIRLRAGPMRGGFRRARPKEERWATFPFSSEKVVSRTPTTFLPHIARRATKLLKLLLSYCSTTQQALDGMQAKVGALNAKHSAIRQANATTLERVFAGSS